MRLIEFSVKNPVFSNLLMATIIIFGFYIGKNLPKELFPSIGFERVTIVTIYENSTAEDVEKLITIPIEDQISGISGIKKSPLHHQNQGHLLLLNFCLMRI